MAESRLLIFTVASRAAGAELAYAATCSTRPWAGCLHPRIQPRKEPAQTAAAPTTITWNQYAMALPS